MSNDQQQSASKYQTDINSTFTEIAQKSFFFIDKSLDAIKLLQLNSKHVMVLRPPKFGKSIMMDMIEDYFLQRTESFQKLNCKILTCGLKFAKENATTVIRFKLKTNMMTRENYNEELLGEIKKLYEKFKVSNFDTFSSPNDALENLIAEITCYGQKRIVVLIDDIDSILLSIKFNSPIFQEIVSTIQNIFEVIKRWKDSIKFLLLLGVANFYNISDFVKDYTYRHETAGIFGFNLNDMMNSNIFYNQVGENVRLPETKVQTFGNFQKSLQTIYDFSLYDFHLATQSNLSGKISIEFLFYLIIHSGNYKFSQISTVSVISPIDFLCSMSESKIGTYWMNYMITQFRNNEYFIAFPNGEEALEQCLMDLLIRGNVLLVEDAINYHYLISLGFLSFRKESVCVPNLTIFEFISNFYVNLLYRRCPRNYISLRKSPFNVILEKMPIFPEYELLPTAVFKNNCWDLAMLIYLYHIYPDIKIQVANDGTFLIITNGFILSLFFTGDLEKRLSALERETTSRIIIVQISVTKVVCIETCFKVNDQIRRYKLDFFNPNNYYLTSIFPFLYSAEDMKKTSNEIIAQSGTEEEGKKEIQHVDPNKLFSFADIVKNSLASLTNKKQFVTINSIINDLIKRMPHFASDPNLDKSVLLSLFYLSKTGYVVCRTSPQGIYEYSAVQCQCLKT